MVQNYQVGTNSIPSFMSPSQLSTYTKCGKAWEYRYIEGLKIPPGGAMLRGRALDGASNRHYTSVAQQLGGLSKEEFVEIAVDEHTKEAATFKDFLDMPISQSIDTVAWGAGAYHQGIAIYITPRSEADVQKKVEMTTPSGVPIMGYIDLVTTSPQGEAIFDTKFKGRFPPQAEVDSSIQLTSYSMMEQVPIVGLGIVKPNGETKIMKSERDQYDYAMIDNRYGTAWEMIHKGVALPAVTGAWYCSEKWCGYWQRCPYGAAGRPSTKAGPQLFQMLPVSQQADLPTLSPEQQSAIDGLGVDVELYEE